MSAACPYCRGSFEADDGIKTCPACATPHHKDCFNENGGCTVFGCVNAPGDEAKITILLEDLGSDSSPQGHASTPTPRTISPVPPSHSEPIPTPARAGAYVAERDEAEQLRVIPRFAMLSNRYAPAPPRLPWGLLVLFSLLTVGLFQVVWDLVLALWMRKVQPQSRALYYASGVLVLCLITFASVVGARTNDTPAWGVGWFDIGLIALTLMGRFSMRKSLENYFDEAGPIGFCLSEGMTFFFGSIYFQYHLNRMIKQKEHRHAIA